MSDPKRSSADSFEQKLLTGDGKWWEFLDPDTYQVKDGLPGANRSTSDQLDWSRTRPKRKLPGPVGFAFFNQCNTCGQGVPPDFTFCVHCGGEPRSIDPSKTHSIVIAGLDTDQAGEAAVELVVKAGSDLDPAEVRAIFAAPPAIFNVSGRRDQIAALTAKLAEVGIRARAFDVDDPSVPWFRETLESIARAPGKLAVAAALALGTLVMSVWWSWGFGLLGAIALVGFGFRELHWYRNRYHLDIRRMLELVTGFDRRTAEVARETLRKLRDGEVRSHVTVCLMEYYTLTQQLRAHSAVYGDVLESARETLEELMADVLGLAHKFAQIDEFIASNPPAAIEQRIAELRDRESADPTVQKMESQEIDALQKRLEDTRRMETSRGSFRERLRALANSMEHLRTRIAAVRSSPSEEAWREIRIDEALGELDEEFAIFEETFEVMS